MIDRAAGSVIVIADNEAVRLALKGTIERAGDFCVNGAATLAEAAGAARRLRPDIAVVEMRLRDGLAIRSCRQIREAWPSCRLLTLTPYMNDEDLLSALLAGASACILKQVRSRSDLADTISHVRAGENLLPGQLGPYLKRLLDPASSPLDDADRALLALVSARKTDSQIAESLHASLTRVGDLIDGLGQKLTSRRPASTDGP